MRLREIPIQQITEADIQELVKTKAIEDRYIDYKRDQIGSSDGDKKEFLADVSAFANAGGGDLLIGVEDDTKSGPISVPGIDITRDAEIRRLTNIINDGLEPKIYGFKVEAIPLQNKKYVIIVRIPKSWISPHRIVLAKSSVFYLRDTNGRHPMTTAEIKTAYNLSASIAQQMRDFRYQRIGDIIAQETPMPLPEGAKMVVHIIPLNAFDPGNPSQVDVEDIARTPYRLNPLYESANGRRRNFDGFVTYRTYFNPTVISYAQLFRNGIIEAVDSEILASVGDNKTIPTNYEGYLVNALPYYLTLQKDLGIELPVFISLSFINVKGFFVGDLTSPGYILRRGQDTNKPIDKNVLFLPEIEVLDFDHDVSVLMHPIFNIVWNAGGKQKSENYDEKGEWDPKEKIEYNYN